MWGGIESTQNINIEINYHEFMPGQILLASFGRPYPVSRQRVLGLMDPAEMRLIEFVALGRSRIPAHAGSTGLQCCLMPCICIEDLWDLRG